MFILLLVISLFGCIYAVGTMRKHKDKRWKAAVKLGVCGLLVACIMLATGKNAVAPLTSTTVKSALETDALANPFIPDTDFPENIFRVEISDNPHLAGHARVALYYKPKSDHDTDIAVKMGGIAIHACVALFQNPLIDEVTCVAMTEHPRGCSYELGRLTFKRATADKINWQDAVKSHASDPGKIFRTADSQKLHALFVKDIDPHRVRLQ